MSAARSKTKTTHVIAACYRCQKQWEGRSAVSSARKHAEDTGHQVTVERGQVWSYNPRR